MGRHLRRMETSGALIDAPDRAESAEEKDLLAVYIRQISRYPLLSAADEQEIGEAILLAASPRGSFMTGSVIMADGGATAGKRI